MIKLVINLKKIEPIRPYAFIGFATAIGLAIILVAIVAVFVIKARNAAFNKNTSFPMRIGTVPTFHTATSKS